MIAFGVIGFVVSLFVILVAVERAVRFLIFVNRYGWRRARTIHLRDWIEMFVNPPDSLDGVYYPSKAGRAMKERHDLEDAYERSKLK